MQCQVGLNNSTEIDVSSLLLKITKKLLFWSKAKLLFAGIMIVVNQVFLSSLWYILMLEFFEIMYGIVTKIDPELLVSSNDGSHARAKVSWSMIGNNWIRED